MQKRYLRILKASIILIVINIGFIPYSAAQFTDSGITPEKTYGSAVNWVDIDGDGDLDLSVSGNYYDPFSPLGKLYINNGSGFNGPVNIQNMSNGDQVWCDFNNDGYPELLYAGSISLPATTSAGIHVFNRTTFSYTSLSTGFVPVKNASVDWGDYDNDGDYDVLITGEDTAGFIFTRIYRNDNAVFTDVNAGLPGVIDGKVAFIDYDLDQDLDIFISGKDVNSNKYTRLWKNSGGTYTITGDLFVNLKYSQFDWGDFNNDRYPDLLLGGLDDPVKRGIIYINNSGNSFTQSGIEVPAAYNGTSDFVDVDNDGDLDILISGAKDTNNDKFIFINNGSGAFVPASLTITPVASSFLQPGDWDGDNDLDIVINGQTYLAADAYGLTKIYHNSNPYTKPEAPLNPVATVEGTGVHLSWDPSLDDHTDPKALTYNIYVDTSSYGVNIVSPNASVPSGKRWISRPGYIQDTEWTIKNLPVGTYFWGVQAINNSLGASAFSAEGTFEIKERFSIQSFSETPSVSSPAVYFDCDHDNDLDMALNYPDVLYIGENKNGAFLESNYKTILPTGYNPIKTITPNDYDNNNLMDFSISGMYLDGTYKNSPIRLYGYNSSFNYNLINNSLINNVSFEYVIWADFNNDGKQDLLTSGKTTNLATNIPVTYLYQNKGNGVFQEVSHTIRGFEKCGAVAGDFDNDMDIDFLIYGKDGSGSANTYVYVNQGNFTFTETLLPDNEIYREYLRFGIQTGDFDLNGELDFYMAGGNISNDYYARVLLNHNMMLSDANLPVRSSPWMSNYWADYDCDGDLDIFSTTVGIGSSNDKMRLYLNNNGTLTELTFDLGAQQKLDLPLMAVNIDNKNGLDFLVKNYSTNYYYHQYFDNWGSSQKITSAPGNMRYNQEQLEIILNWDKIPDCPGCTYNIRVGTQTGKVDIMSPMADLTTGYRYVVQPGNAYLNDGWKLSGLPFGTYYWSVQAVDPSNTGGPWAPEQSFVVSQIDAEFSYTTVCHKDTTVFTDLSVATDAVVSWEWDFGDGSTSTLKNPEHLYASSGTYVVGLRAYSASGYNAFQSHSVTVKTTPLATFTADIACQGSATTIVNNTNTYGLTIDSWQWNFGDGQTSSLKDPGTHGYIAAGSYKAELWVFADNGCHDSVSKNIIVSSYPVAVISANAPLAFCSGDSVILSVQHNANYDYIWKLNGTALTNSDTNKYIAKLSGNYSAEITNPVGNCIATSAQVSVVANNSPEAPLIVASGSVQFCQGDSVKLSVTNTLNHTFQWKLNGGAVGTNSNQFVAKTSGTYNLLVSNISGCSATSANSIIVTVNPAPVVGALALEGKKKFCSGESAILSVPATAGYLYAWINSDGTITGASTNSYIVNTSGEYKLEVSNSSGCKVTTDPVKIEVVEKPSKPAIDTSFYDKGMCLGESPLKISVDDVVAGYNYKWYRNGTSFSNSTSVEVIDEGIYHLEAVSDICTSLRDSAVIDFREALPKPDIIVRGPTVWMLSTTSKANQYKWFLNGTLIPGAGSSIYVAGQNFGLYRLAVSDESGCYSFSDTIRIPLGITGIEDMNPFEDVKIYPNPTTGMFTIEMNNNVLGELIIDIFTQNGSKILNIKFEKTTEHFQSQIDLSGQSKGMYLINLSLNKFKAVRKVLVE